MNTTDFLETVDETYPGDTDEIDVRDATYQTLRTLGDRITGGQAEALADGLPEELRDPLTDTEEDATEFDREQFLEHVAFRAKIGTEDPMDVTQAVIGALVETDAVTEGDLEDVRSQLPADFEPLFAAVESA